MNPEPIPENPVLNVVPPEQPAPPAGQEGSRVKLFLGIQLFFLVLLVFTGRCLPPDRPAPPAGQEASRVKLFLGIQFFFLVLSVFTGGFNFKLWSMLDSALLIQSIVVTSLVLVLDEEKHRRLAFKAAVVLYLLALLDMGVNVLISGVVGWKS